MKHTPIYLILLIMLFGACERIEYTSQITGTLYTDSTLTTPVANDTLWFYNYSWVYADSTYHASLQECIGHCLTDGQGRFGFLFWSFDVGEMTSYEQKWEMTPDPSYLILHGQDTLFCGSYRANYKDITLYKGRPVSYIFY